MASKEHREHGSHTHEHKPGCGHMRIQWAPDHVDYLHDGHLHHQHEGHWDEDVIPVNDQNPDVCNQAECKGHEDGPMIPHGDHMDRLVNGRLHHEHQGHCDDHGPVQVLD